MSAGYQPLARHLTAHLAALRWHSKQGLLLCSLSGIRLRDHALHIDLLSIPMQSLAYMAFHLAQHGLHS